MSNLNHLNNLNNLNSRWLILMAVFLAILGLMLAAAFDGPYAQGALKWTRVGNFSSAYSVRCMALYQNKLYVGLGDGKVMRYNGGNSWTDIHKPNDSIGMYVYSMTTFGNLLVVGGDFNNGARVWTYNGSTWSQINDDGFGLGSTIYQARALAVYNNELYATGSGNGQKFRVYKYSGSGTVWADVTGLWDDHVALSAISWNGYLWVGTENTSTGTEIWRYDGTNWTQANKDGFG